MMVESKKIVLEKAPYRRESAGQPRRHSVSRHHAGILIVSHLRHLSRELHVEIVFWSRSEVSGVSWLSRHPQG